MVVSGHFSDLHGWGALFWSTFGSRNLQFRSNSEFQCLLLPTTANLYGHISDIHCTSEIKMVFNVKFVVSIIINVKKLITNYLLLFFSCNRQLLILMVVVLMDLLVQVLLHLWSLLQLH